MAAAVAAVAVLQAAKMIVNIGQAVKGLSDSDKAMESARKQAAELRELNDMRAYARSLETRDLVGGQNVALAQSGFASSSAARAVGNRALMALHTELRADQIETQQRIDELFEQAAQAKAQARQNLIGTVAGESIDATTQMVQSGTQARRRGTGQDVIDSGKPKVDVKSDLTYNGDE